MKIYKKICPPPDRSCLAFTLAEILITLGIIGVIAALTMPALISNHRKTIVETRLKKFYSVMNQAILMTNKEYGGEYSYWYPEYLVKESPGGNNGTSIDKSAISAVAFKKYLAPKLNIVSEKTITDKLGKTRIIYYFGDGSAFAFSYHTNRDIEFFPSNPEKCLEIANMYDRYGSCSFMFIFYPIEFTAQWKYHQNKGLEPYLYNWNGTENGLRSLSSHAAGIIQRNSWKIPNDYPWKLKL